MKKEFFAKLKNKCVTRIRGHFSEIVIDGQMLIIKNVYTFPSLHRNLPFYIICGKKSNYLGISLARQSSDFLVKVFQKKVYEQSSKVKIIQYRFPKDVNSLKLIVFFEWDNPNDFQMIYNELQVLQSKFLSSIDDLLS